eukprot:snap_masked-scaffold_14-processed-gene-7.58-mRNA-1 protein AED:1.00 eAED:1.00 QI:0/-1/0/0/-1/1/1/0/61
MGGSFSKPDPCEELFKDYLNCAKKYAYVHPEEYGEYCEEEKSLYVDCRHAQLYPDEREEPF